MPTEPLADPLNASGGPRRARRAALAALAALAAAAPFAAPAAAGADSISYVKDGNVFLTTPDGAKTLQVTTGGGYATASQADDGRIIAAKGGRLHLLSRHGDVLADFSPVAPGTAGSITLNGPFDPAISPDGSKVAYGFYVQYKSGDPNCGRPGGCQVGHLYAGTGYTRSDGAVEWSQDGFRPEWGWSDPSWIDGSRTLLGAADSAFITDTAIDGAGDAANAAEWFSDPTPDSSNLYDGELNRQGTAVAFVTNTQGDNLRIWRLAGAPQQGVVPAGCLNAPAQGGPWSSPSWSPDGERVVFAGPDGLYVTGLPGLNTSCPDASRISVQTIAPGGRSPDWGPAGVPDPRPAPVSGTPGPGTGSSTGQGPAAAGARATLAAARAKLRGALRAGLVVRVSGHAARSVALTARWHGATVARGSASVRGGHASVRLRFTVSARRALSRARSARLVIGGAGTRSLTLTLRG